MKMKVTMRTIGSIRDAINSLHFIVNHTKDELLKNQCQNMINILFDKFPGIMPSSNGII